MWAWAEKGEAFAALGPPADISNLAAQLSEEVDRLAKSHRLELNACVERCMRTLQESHDFAAQSTRSFASPPACVPGEDNPNRAHDAGVETEELPPLPPEQLAPVARMVTNAPTMTLSSSPTSESPARPSRKKKKTVADLLKPKDLGTQQRTWLERITSSRYWEWGSGMLIVLNAIFIGWHTQTLAVIAEDAAASGRPFQSEEPAAFFALQVIFTVLFTFELGFRWVCNGLVGFFRDQDVWWNALDVWVVSFGLLDLFLILALQSDVLGNLSILRVIRVVRIVRIARVIRVMKFFRELRMMIYSILRSMKSLLWVILVLALTFYVFGIAFTHATLAALDTLEAYQDPSTQDVRHDFGTLDRSVLSLFMSMSGGNDWAVYYESLGHLPWPYRFLFLLYISFSVFAVLNIVTGVFVDSAMLSNTEDKTITAHEELDSKKAYLRAMSDIFNEMDEDATGSLTLQEFESKLADERVVAYFNAMKLDVSDAHKLFVLLDHNKSGEVDIQEFISGCYQLQGESRSLDVKLMQYEMKFVCETLTKMSASVASIQASTRALQSSML